MEKFYFLQYKSLYDDFEKKMEGAEYYKVIYNANYFAGDEDYWLFY